MARILLTDRQLERLGQQLDAVERRCFAADEARLPQPELEPLRHQRYVLKQEYFGALRDRGFAACRAIEARAYRKSDYEAALTLVCDAEERLKQLLDLGSAFYTIRESLEVQAAEETAGMIFEVMSSKRKALQSGTVVRRRVITDDYVKTGRYTRTPDGERIPIVERVR